MDPAIAQLQAQVAELMAWKVAHEIQQITFPLDDASKNTLGAYQRIGLGTTAPTRSITIGAGGGSATVPTNPVGSIIIQAEGERAEVPVLSFV